MKKEAKILEALERGALSHALLIQSQESAQSLESFFKGFLCLNSTQACGKCESCLVPLSLSSFERRHPDFMCVGPENETGYSVDQVRSWNSSFIQLSKNLSPRKLLLVTQAEKLSGTGAQGPANALLKILEEPRNGVFLILLTTNALRLLETIRSRCLKISLETKESSLEDPRVDFLVEVQNALKGTFTRNSLLSNAQFWKNRAEKLSVFEAQFPWLWQNLKSHIINSESAEAKQAWQRWKHFEAFLKTVKQYGNPALHWLNFKRKVIAGEAWNT